MKYLSNQFNRTRLATLIATNILASNVIGRVDQADKAGGGDVTLGGDYVGQDDHTIDIQIVDNTISGAPSTSNPQFFGAGNGALTDLAATSSVNVQTITVTLVDTGSLSLQATTQFQGIEIRAKLTGTGGNDITIAVDRSGLGFGDTPYTLSDDLQAGGDGNQGDEWNFGNSLIPTPTSDIPATAPRVVFGFDPQVYRLYKTTDGQGVATYFTSPDVVRAVPAGAKVRSVTGTYVLTVTNGVTTEVFGAPGGLTTAPIQTLYDALTALQSSTLVEISVPGFINNNKSPDGMGIDDVGVFTESYVQSVSASGSTAVQRAVPAFAATFLAGPDSPSGILQINCTTVTTRNSETWEVIDPHDGALLAATTNVAYTSADYQFTIPTVVDDGSGGTGGGTQVPNGPSLLASIIPINPIISGTSPSICVDRPALGANAVNGSWDFVWTQRPAPPCDCDSEPMQGGPSLGCLGVAPTNSGGGAVTEDSLLLRLQRVAKAVQGFVSSNTSPPTGIASTDVSYIEASAKIFVDGLTAAAAGPKVNYDPWTATTVYALDEQVEPAIRNGYRYYVSSTSTIPAHSGSSAPTWPTTIGSTVVDGDITWSCLGLTMFGLWDQYETAWESEMSVLSGFGTGAAVQLWAASRNISFFVVSSLSSGAFVKPTVGNGFVYRFMNENQPPTTGASQPTWPLNLTTQFSDGNIVWRGYVQYWVASTSYALNTVTNPYTGALYKVTTAGTSGSTEPSWTTATVTDGGVTWTRQASFDLPVGTDGSGYFDKFTVQMQEVNSVAGNSPDFKEASTNGDGCWQDWNEGDYFANPSYLFIQPGHYYHAATESSGPDGTPVYSSTHEWGFGPKIGCPDQLEYGDILRVTVSGIADGGSGGGTPVGNGYQTGDSFLINLVHTGPLQLTGGQTGDNTLTWTVVGTGVDAQVFTPYSLVTTALTAYADGGLSFQITPGLIPYQRGDYYVFDIEGGRFKWRTDGGSWSADTAIADTVTLGSEGLVASFLAGVAPSWVALDTWSFLVEAVNGPDNVRTPRDGALAWHTSLQLDLDPGSAIKMNTLMIGEHTIPSSAEIHIQGSNDNWATTAYDEKVTWADRNISFEMVPTVALAKYRLTVNTAGSIQWLYLSEVPLILKANDRSTSVDELGILSLTMVLPNALVRAGFSIEADHTFVSRDSFLDLASLLNWAGENDQGRFGIIPTPDEINAMIVTVSEVTKPTASKDQLDFQSNDGFRAIDVSLTMDPIP